MTVMPADFADFLAGQHGDLDAMTLASSDFAAMFPEKPDATFAQFGSLLGVRDL